MSRKGRLAQTRHGSARSYPPSIVSGSFLVTALRLIDSKKDGKSRTRPEPCGLSACVDKVVSVWSGPSVLAVMAMPECENCGETHATVNPAEWCEQEVILCPGCWAKIRDGEIE